MHEVSTWLSGGLVFPIGFSAFFLIIYKYSIYVQLETVYIYAYIYIYLYTHIYATHIYEL
jgi:hypothetical protein